MKVDFLKVKMKLSFYNVTAYIGKMDGKYFVFTTWDMFDRIEDAIYEMWSRGFDIIGAERVTVEVEDVKNKKKAENVLRGLMCGGVE